MNKKPFYFKSDVLAQKNITLPKDMLATLNDISKAKRVPVAMLVCRAIANELDREAKFDYNTTLPRPTEETSAPGADLLFNFIKSNTGLNLDYLLMMRRKIGVHDKKDLLAAYVLLLKADLIEEYRPTSTYFEHRADYKVCRVKKEEEKYKIPKPIGRYKKIKSTLDRSILDEIDES